MTFRDYPEDWTAPQIADYIKVEYISSLSGKYARQVLTRIERDSLLDPVIRKHILDGFADYAREIREFSG